VQERPGPLVVPPPRAPQHPGAGRAGQIVGHKPRVGRVQHQLQVGVGIEVRQGGSGQRSVPVDAAKGRRQIDLVDGVAHGVQDVQLARLAAPLLDPGGDNDLGVPVTVQVGDGRLGGKAVGAAGMDRVGPVAVLGLVQPEGVDTAVVGRKEDLQLAVAVQVGQGRVGLVVLDLAIVLAQRRARVDGRCLPVVAARGKAAAVGVEQVDAVVLARWVPHGAVVDVAHGRHFRQAVAVDVADGRRAVGKVGAIALFAHAVARAPASQLDGLALPDADLAPGFAAVHGVGRDVAAAGLVGADVVDVGGHDDLAQAVAVEVADGGVVVVDARGVAAVVGQLGPAGAQRPVVLVDPGVDLAGGGGHDDLQGSVAVQVIGRQASQLAIGRVAGPTGLEVALVVIDRDDATAVGGDDLQVAVAVHVGHDDAGPGAAHVAGVGLAAVVARLHAPPERARRAIEDDDGIGRSDDLGRPVAVEVGHGGGRVPARLAPRVKAAAELPLQDRRLKGRSRLRGARRGLNCHPGQCCDQDEKHRASRPPVRLHRIPPCSALWRTACTFEINDVASAHQGREQRLIVPHAVGSKGYSTIHPGERAN